MVNSYVYQGYQSVLGYSGGGNGSYIITPQLQLNSDKTLTFKYRSNTTSPANFRVGVSSTGNNFSDFTWSSNINGGYTSWQTYSRNIDPSVKYIAINFIGTSYTIYVDNFELNGDNIVYISGVDINSNVQPVSVCAGTPNNYAISKLTNTIRLLYSDGTSSVVPVSWSIINYNASQSGIYNAIGVFSLPLYIAQTNPPTPLEVNTSVTVVALPNVTCPNDMEVTTHGVIALTGGLPDGGIYSGMGVSNNQFNSTGLTDGIYSVTYTYTNLNTGCSNSCTFNITVNVITYIAGIDINNDVIPLSVCQGTTISAVQNMLPAQIKIADSDGEQYSVNVNWSISGYNANIPDVYTANGTFSLPDGIYQSNPPTPLEVNTSVTVVALPNVTCPSDIEILPNTYVVLSGGLPAGGVYSGTGVVGGVIFDATGLNDGFYVITYTYSDYDTECENSCSFVITVRGSNIDNLTTDKIIISPNPNHGSFTLNFGSIKETANYQIYDSQGKMITEENLFIEQSCVKNINLNLQAGVYYIKINCEKESHVEKIVVW
jgi:hypothetical protein